MGALGWIPMPFAPQSLVPGRLSLGAPCPASQGEPRPRTAHSGGWGSMPLEGPDCRSSSAFPPGLPRTPHHVCAGERLLSGVKLRGRSWRSSEEPAARASPLP